MVYTSYEEIYTEKKRELDVWLKARQPLFREKERARLTHRLQTERGIDILYSFKSKRDLHSFALVRERERDVLLLEKYFFQHSIKK